ncbi:hypothetical protein SAMN05216344_101255 [Polaromonas sp. OV174]|nr:hypothetical protein SAMN05216344_101255 [Polaromonas sp. OV174]
MAAAMATTTVAATAMTMTAAPATATATPKAEVEKDRRPNVGGGCINGGRRVNDLAIGVRPIGVRHGGWSINRASAQGR